MSRTALRVRVKGQDREYGMDEIEVICDPEALGEEQEAKSIAGGLAADPTTLMLILMLTGARRAPTH